MVPNKDSDEKEAKVEPLTSAEDRENVRKFGAIHASISLIHYFDKKCGKEDEAKLDEDDRLKNRTEEVPLGKHVDTGLMTLITCSDVAGLEVLDRRSDKYYHAEKQFDERKHVFVIA